MPFQQLKTAGQEAKATTQTGEEFEIGCTDLSDPDNLDIQTVSISLTHRHTFAHVLTSPIQERMNPQGELGTAEWRAILDKLYQEGVENIIFTGGDPTIRQDFHTLLQYAINQFENVTVQTAGGTDRNLSDYQCVVSVPIDYWNPIDNNEIRRMTNPNKWLYHRNKEKLVARQYETCGICGNSFDSERGLKTHFRQRHGEQALQDYEGISEWSNLTKSKRFDWSEYLQKPEPIDILEKEKAKTIAKWRIESVDNPVIIRTSIMNNNDLSNIIAYAQAVEADVAFQPLYPNGNQRLEEQMPNPRRILKCMEKVWQLDGIISQNFRIDTPLYKAFSRKADLAHDVEPEYGDDTFKSWLKRGRVSQVGVNRLHLTPAGGALPSKYLRGSDYYLGSVLEKGFDFIYEALAEFNKRITLPEKDYRPAFKYSNGEVKELPDLRRRNLAADPNIYLQRPYPGVNDAIQSKSENSPDQSQGGDNE